MRSDYLLPDAPYGLDFRNMSPAEARVHYKSYIADIPERTEMLRHLMHGDGYTWNPYYSEASLHVLGDWYQTQVSVAPRSAELIQKDRDNLPEWFHSDIPVEDLTAYTLWLCLDSGGYLGELFILKFPSIRWSIQKGKSTLYFNQPVIGKFIRGMTVSPFQLVTVIAYKCVDGVLASNEFLRLLEVYSELVV